MQNALALFCLFPTSTHTHAILLLSTNYSWLHRARKKNKSKPCTLIEPGLQMLGTQQESNSKNMPKNQVPNSIMMVANAKRLHNENAKHTPSNRELPKTCQSTVTTAQSTPKRRAKSKLSFGKHKRGQHRPNHGTICWRGRRRNIAQVTIEAADYATLPQNCRQSLSPSPTPQRRAESGCLNFFFFFF